MITVYIKLEVINNVSFCKVASAMDVLELISRPLQTTASQANFLKSLRRSDPGWKNHFHFQHGIIGYASQPDGLFLFLFFSFLKEMENSLSHKKKLLNMLQICYIKFTT